MPPHENDTDELSSTSTYSHLHISAISTLALHLECERKDPWIRKPAPGNTKGLQQRFPVVPVSWSQGLDVNLDMDLRHATKVNKALFPAPPPHSPVP